MDRSVFGLNDRRIVEAGDDWIIEAGEVGDQLSMKVWKLGAQEPADPQWTYTDTTFSPQEAVSWGAQRVF